MFNINKYLGLRRLHGHVHMVPPQQGSIVWATGIVIKKLRVWHHGTLPPPPLMWLAVFHILVHCLKLLLLHLLFLLHVHLIILLLMLRLRLDISTLGTTTPRNNTILHHPLVTLSHTGSMPYHPYVLSRGGTLCNMHKTKSAQTQNKTEDQISFWVFSDLIFRIATNMSEKGNLDCLSAEEKKTVKLTCMHREIKLTFHLMFIKGWNAVLLSKKTPILVGLLLFGIWDKREREKVKSETVKLGVNFHLYFEAVRNM